MYLQEKIENWAKDHPKYEAVFFYNVNTEEIVGDEITDNEADSVNPLSFLESHNCENLVCVHNHPPTYVDGIRKWKPLSINDIFVNASFNTAGVIANDGVNLYSIFRATDNWGTLVSTPPEDFDRIWIETYDMLEEEDRKKIEASQMSLREYYQEREIFRTNEVFKKYGISPMKVISLV